MSHQPRAEKTAKVHLIGLNELPPSSSLLQWDKDRWPAFWPALWVRAISAQRYLSRIGVSPQLPLKMEVAEYVNRSALVDNILAMALLNLLYERLGVEAPATAGVVIPESQSLVDYDPRTNQPRIVLDGLYYQQELRRCHFGQSKELAAVELSNLLNRDFTRLAPKLTWIVRTQAWRHDGEPNWRVVRNMAAVPLSYWFALTHPWTFFSSE